MKRAVFLLSLLATSSLALAQDKPLPQPRHLAFTHVTLIDGTGAPPRSDTTVVITADRISELGAAKQVAIPKDAQVIDASGKFLLPGLSDMHIHWFGYDKAYLGLFVANGVTGVRIMWGAPIHYQWRKEMQERGLLAPRMSIASNIVDGPKPIWPGTIAVGNETQGREAVRKIKQGGADFVKVYSLLPRDAYFAIADESKKLGIPFAGHVPESVSILEASDVGQKSVEHLTGVLSACSTREEDLRREGMALFTNLPKGQRMPSPARTQALKRMTLDTFSPEKADALAAHLARTQTWQCPTLTVLRAFANLDNKEFTRDPRLKYMPTTMKAFWDPKQDFRMKDRAADDYQLARLYYKKQVEVAGRLHHGGVPFLAGTDVGNPYCFPGFSLHDELGLLVEAGLTPMEALLAATLNPARFLGEDKDLGTIEKGKLADLVLLDANPLENIGNTQKINAVVFNGRLLDRPSLDKMLAAVEAAAKKN